jgi:hypothetical protein
MLARGVGIRFKGVEKTNPIAIKPTGKAEPYFRR